MYEPPKDLKWGLKELEDADTLEAALGRILSKDRGPTARDLQRPEGARAARYSTSTSPSRGASVGQAGAVRQLAVPTGRVHGAPSGQDRTCRDLMAPWKEEENGQTATRRRRARPRAPATRAALGATLGRPRRPRGTRDRRVTARLRQRNAEADGPRWLLRHGARGHHVLGDGDVAAATDDHASSSTPVATTRPRGRAAGRLVEPVRPISAPRRSRRQRHVPRREPGASPQAWRHRDARGSRGGRHVRREVVVARLRALRHRRCCGTSRGTTRTARGGRGGRGAGTWAWAR